MSIRSQWTCFDVAVAALLGRKAKTCATRYFENNDTVFTINAPYLDRVPSGGIEQAIEWGRYRGAPVASIFGQEAVAIMGIRTFYKQRALV